MYVCWWHKRTTCNCSLKEFYHAFQLRANISGYSEVFTISVKATTNNDKALGSLLGKSTINQNNK